MRFIRSDARAPMPIKAKPSFSLKDELFNKHSVALLAENIHAASSEFDDKSFQKQALARFPELELKERIAWLVTTLENHLPRDFPGAVAVLEAALPEPLDPDLTDDDFGKYIWTVPGEYVAKHGCSTEYITTSLNFLRESTKRASAESAIRPFLQQFPDETMAFVSKCSVDDNYHVRRLASEGIRPLLPWALRVTVPPARIVEVLDTLHADSTRYVMRSVANTLNDISKQDAQLVIRTLKKWRKAKRQNVSELEYMTRHALRTLVKQGHPEALKLLGFTSSPAVEIADVVTTKVVNVGESYEFRCTVRSTVDQKLLISLCIHFLKANGSYSTKVFAVKNLEMRKGESIHVKKRQPFKPITTRTLYPGLHKAELLINGAVVATNTFDFVA
ncbi:MAG: DNA alkylation repair protein [Gammaproteobacteria bacterium]|nr:DNA alkylation repair protein [Gammaproteobacteria bacterium]